MISDKSQGRVAEQLWCGGLFMGHFTVYFSLSLVMKKNVYIGGHLLALQCLA